ncbi:MAG: hypothetical protein DWG76_01750 [Chloroflexi bacterium]|nr:hypothetical protein [Chloroflexota bacterium]MQC26157.1 hypothetical protein [Chloroflexota bacterium]
MAYRSKSLSRPTAQIQTLHRWLPQVRAGQIYLLVGPAGLVGPIAQELTHHFAIRGAVRVLLGGNRFSLERLPLLLGDRGNQIYEILDRIQVSRGETCYQLLHALEKTPRDSIPFILTDALETLYEDGLTLIEVERVLRDSLANLRQISESAPVLLSAAHRPDRPGLLETLIEAVDHVIEVRPNQPLATPQQLPLLPNA